MMKQQFREDNIQSGRKKYKRSGAMKVRVMRTGREGHDSKEGIMNAAE